MQEFIWQHDLNQDFLGEIATFVEQQTKGRTLEAQPALVPSASPMDIDARGPSRPTVCVPCATYLVFSQAKVDPILSKIAEFNAARRAAAENHVISEDDWGPTQRMIAEATDVKSLIGSKQYASIEKMVSWDVQQLFVGKARLSFFCVYVMLCYERNIGVCLGCCSFFLIHSFF